MAACSMPAAHSRSCALLLNASHRYPRTCPLAAALHRPDCVHPSIAWVAQSALLVPPAHAHAPKPLPSPGLVVARPPCTLSSLPPPLLSVPTRACTHSFCCSAEAPLYPLFSKLFPPQRAHMAAQLSCDRKTEGVPGCGPHQ